MDMACHDHAPAGDGEAGSNRVSPRDRPIPTQSFGESRHGTGDGDALVATVVDPSVHNVAIAAGSLVTEEVLPLIWTNPAAGPGVELDDFLPAFGLEVEEQDAGASEATTHRVDDSLHQSDGDRRVNCIAASPQNVDACLGGDRLWTHNHAVAPAR
jgi:hypothetical protein